VQSQTLSHPFWSGQSESVGAIFWRVLLRCGVAAGLACAFLLWGVTLAVLVAGTVLLSAVYAVLVAGLFRPQLAVGRSVVLAARAALCLTAAVAVIAIAHTPGALLVALCLGLTPSVRRNARSVAAWARHPRRLTSKRG
jgi:hypothetical protein